MRKKCAALFLPLVLVACGDDAAAPAVRAPLRIEAHATYVEAGRTIVLQASGGRAPRVFELLSGDGAITEAGVFTASERFSEVRVGVRDATGARASSRLVTIAPTTMEGVIFWLRAADLTGEVGSHVSTWVDATGGGHDFVAAAEATAPTIAESAFTGSRAVVFDGVDDLMRGSSFRAERVGFIVAGTGYPGSGPRRAMIAFERDEWHYLDLASYSSVLMQYDAFATRPDPLTPELGGLYRSTNTFPGWGEVYEIIAFDAASSPPIRELFAFLSEKHHLEATSVGLDARYLGPVSCASMRVVGVRDGRGARAVLQGAAVELSSTGVDLFADEGCSIPLEHVAIEPGSWASTFYYVGRGTVSLTSSSSLPVDAQLGSIDVR